MRALGISILALSVFILNSALAADTNQPPRLTVDLRDGSRIIGESLKKNIEFHSTLLGDMKLSVNDIRFVECLSSNTATLSTTAGDVLTVSFLDSELPVKTSFGKVELPINSIRKIMVISPVAHPPGLVGLWRGEDEGRDGVGDNNATLNNITTVDSPMGPAFHLNGINSFMQIPDSSALRPASITVAVWVKLDAVATPDANSPGQQEFVFKRNSHDPRQGNFTSYCLLKNINQFAFCVGTPNGQFFANSIAPPEVGVWYHVVGTYDGDSGEAKIYVNGIQEGAANAGTPLDCGTTPVFIGTTHEWFDAKFQGDLSNIEIYNRALSADEIKSICMNENGGKLPAPPTMRVPSFQPMYPGIYDYPDVHTRIPAVNRLP